MMAVRIRRVSTLIAVLAVAAVLAPAGIAGFRADAPQAYPTLYVQYTMNCTFTIHDDDGKRVTSIAPGDYQIELSSPIFFGLVVPGGESAHPNLAPNDFYGCRGAIKFQLTGPGVDLYSTLDEGCDAFELHSAQTFRPNSTYIFQDLWQPSVTRTALSTGVGAPTPPATPYNPTSDKGQTFADEVGKNIQKALGVKLAGTLNGGVSAVGKPTLTRQGKTVSALKAGRYKITVVDATSKRGFMIQKLGKKSVNVTTTTFVGTKSGIVTLKAGEKWMYTSGLGKAYSFRVTG